MSLGPKKLHLLAGREEAGAPLPSLFSGQVPDSSLKGARLTFRDIGFLSSSVKPHAPESTGNKS